MQANPRRLVVIGGVAAGTSAASRARRTDQILDIVIFESGPFVSYGACDEPYYIAGEIASWEKLLVRAPEEFENRQNIKIRLHHQVTAIDPEKKTVAVLNKQSGESFTANWDRLIIATGAYPRPLDVNGKDLPGIFQMKFLTQARQIKEFIENHRPQKAVIIGAGLVALEMAEALTANGIAVTLCHRSRTPGGNTDPEIADRIIKTLESHNVTYLTECRIQGFEQAPNGRVGVVVTNQGRIETDMVIAALGVLPAVEMAAKAGVKLGPTGAISTDSRQQTNLQDIFAAGDCCETVHRITGQPLFTPLGDIANKQGWCAGENAAGGDARYNGSLGSVHFRCFDLEVGMTGLSTRQAQNHFDVVSRMIEGRSRAHAQPKGVKITVKLIADRATHRLIGGQICGTEGAALRTNILATIIHNGMTVEQINDLDFAYAPPFSSVIDPILTAARVMLKDLQG